MCPCPVLIWTVLKQKVSLESAAPNAEAVSMKAHDMITAPSGGLWKTRVRSACVWRDVFTVRKSGVTLSVKTQLLLLRTAAALFAKAVV